MVALEADFSEVYHRDLRDLWVPGSGMTARWVMDHFDQLPHTSRVKKHLIGEEARWGDEEHLLADLRDIAMQTLFYSSITAQKDISSTQWPNIVDELPKPMPRPGYTPEVKAVEPTFTPMEEVLGMFGNPDVIRLRQRS